ncbi:MAG: hypothetical protein R2699_12885 [Acidimicrobiales bacterium]
MPLGVVEPEDAGVDRCDVVEHGNVASGALDVDPVEIREHRRSPVRSQGWQLGLKASTGVLRRRVLASSVADRRHRACLVTADGQDDRGWSRSPDPAVDRPRHRVRLRVLHKRRKAVDHCLEPLPVDLAQACDAQRLAAMSPELIAAATSG